MSNDELDVETVFRKLKELGQRDARPKYATDFIVKFLTGTNRIATTAEIRAALRDANISIKDSSLNWTLTNLNTRGDIERVSRGRYRIRRHEPNVLDEANALYAQERFDQALAAYEEAIRLFPASAVAHIGRAEVLRTMGRFEDALMAYEEAIRRSPANSGARVGRAEVLRRMGRFEDALTAYEEAIRLSPGDAVVHNGRAEALRGVGRLEESLAAYEDTIRRFPADHVAYNGRAEALRSMGRLEESLAAYEDTIRRFPTDLVAYNGRAEVLRELGRFEARPANAALPPPEAIPAPSRRAIQFVSVANGPIDLALVSQAGEHLIGGPNRQEDYDELRAKASEVSVLGSNRLGRLHEPVNRFLSLSGIVDQVRTKLFWSRVNTLRIILLSHEQSAVVQSAEPDERRLEQTVASLLKDLVETINVFVVGDPSLMELDAVRPGPQETEVAKEEASVLGTMIDDLANSPNVATETARQVLSEQVENLEIADESLPGRQAAEFGRRSIQNFVGELLRRAYAPVRDLPRQVASEAQTAWKTVRYGAYQAIGAGLITGAVTDLTGVTHFSSAIVQFVVRHAETLAAYATKSFQNPALVEIIHWIVRFAS
jgi:tetratricopeptide (TPR) repeat protein